MMETNWSFVIWQEFELIALKEMDRILVAVSSTTCVQYPCPSWLVSWIQVVINASLQEVMVLPALKDAVVWFLLNRTPLNPTVLDNFRPLPSLFRKSYHYCTSCTAFHFLSESNSKCLLLPLNPYIAYGQIMSRQLSLKYLPALPSQIGWHSPIPFLKNCHIMESRKHNFSMAVPILWNTLPSEVWQVP